MSRIQRTGRGRVVLRSACLAVVGLMLTAVGIPSLPSVRGFGDNYQPNVTIQFSADNYTVNESAGTVTITATLSQTSAQTITVNYATSDGTAVAGSNYVSTSGQLTFNPGDTGKTFQVTILDNSTPNPPLTVYLALSNPQNATLAAPYEAILTILDDDVPVTVQFGQSAYSVPQRRGVAVIDVILSSPSLQQITVDYTTSNGTAIAPNDYYAASGTLTFSPGTTQQTFQVLLVDTESQNDKTVNLTLSNATNAILGTFAVSVLTVGKTLDKKDNENQVRLDIYHGQGAVARVPENMKDDQPMGGATTVANLNDTDGDGTVDKDQAIVTAPKTNLTAAIAKGGLVLQVTDVKGYVANGPLGIKQTLLVADGEAAVIDSINVAAKTITLKAPGIQRVGGYAAGDIVYLKGRDEIDLMKIILQKPVPNNGGTVELSVRSDLNKVQIYSNSTKEGGPIGLDAAGKKTFATNTLPLTLWVEARAPRGVAKFSGGDAGNWVNQGAGRRNLEQGCSYEQENHDRSRSAARRHRTAGVGAGGGDGATGADGAGWAGLRHLRRSDYREGAKAARRGAGRGGRSAH